MTILVKSFTLFLLLYSTTALSEFKGALNLGLAGGALIGGIPSGGVQGTLKLGKLGFSAAYYMGETSVKTLVKSAAGVTSNVSVNKAKINQTLAQATLKYYPTGGSFFMGFGAGKGDIKGKVELDGGGYDVAETIRYDTVYGSLTFGNIWQFAGVYLGFEWAGYTRVISYTKEEDEETANSLSGDTENAYDKFAELTSRYGEGGNVSLMIIHFGIGL